MTIRGRLRAIRTKRPPIRARRFVERPRGLLVAIPLIVGTWVLGQLLPAQAFPVPGVVYEIEAVSGSHHASLLNLPVGQPGVVQAPIPVDVDGDLIPDVLVSVNLVNVEGVFNNPPDIGEVLAPNISIVRALNGLPLDKPSPPLRIVVKLKVSDFLGDAPDMTLRFGYDTAKGGSIPGSFKALVGGLDSFFNPLEAVIDTRGTLLEVDSPQVAYEGPLTVLANLQQGTFEADASLAYAPFPSFVHVTYGSDDAGQHITYNHGTFPEPPNLPEVDLDTHLKVTDAGDVLDVNALVERLPRDIALDIGDVADGGSVDYRSAADGRLPDVAVDVRNAVAGSPPLIAHANIEALPRSMHGEWSMPPGGAVRAAFNSTGQGIGAIEADVRNFDGDPDAFDLFVPKEQQFLNVQMGKAPGGAPQQFISGRLERIREADVSTTDDGGFDGHIEVGDGERPLEIHGLLDLTDDGGPLVDATTAIAPLPDSIDVSFDPGTEGSADDPLSFHYAASESVDVDADAKVLLEGSGDLVCGAAHTVCAALKARHIPSEITTNVFNINAGPGGDETRIEVDAEPRPGGAKPDFFADATIGQDDGFPLVAHAEVLGLAPFLSARAIEGADQTVERAEFHTCDRDWDADECVPGTSDEIGELNFALRNFIERPADIRPPYAETPNFAAITARGRSNRTDVVDFEAVGRLKSISEVMFLNKGVTGIHTDAGGGKDFSAILDVKDVDLEGDDPANGRIDADAKALVSPLPATFTFCFNKAGQPVASAAHEITQKCQEDYPFPVSETPMSFAYDAPTQFDVRTKASVTFEGPNRVSQADDKTFTGKLNVDNIPSSVEAHVLTPDGEEPGPIRAVIDAPAPAGDQIDVDFAAEILDADLICRDPRLPAGNDQALCVKGKLLNLPTHVDVFYDPTISDDNLLVDTSGSELMDFTDLEFSSVSRSDNDTPNDPADDKPDVLIATGRVLGLPQHIDGTLDMPATDEDAPSVEVNASPPLGTVDLLARNFIAPDPVPFGAPDQRAGIEEPSQQVTYFQRGDSFKAEAHIEDVKGFAYKTVRDGAGKAADTKVVRVDFGTDQVIRAYADIQPDEESRTIADVTLEDVPDGITICFRGKKEKGTAAASEATFCDGNSPNPDFATIDDDEGAFQFKGLPNTDTTGLDVHAFVRHAAGGGADILSGLVDITDIPFVIQGTYPSGDTGDLDIGGFEPDEVTPDGINQIEVQAASFDLPDADVGYGSDQPYQAFTNAQPPFPAPATSNQHASAVLVDDDFNARLRLGPESQFQRIRMNDRPCDKPTDAPRNDYPAFPIDSVSKYTCIRADLFQNTTDTDQLDLHFVKQDGADRIALRDAGITDIPAFVQLTVAETATLNNDADQTLRRPCGPAPDSNCMPPLLRFDQPANTNLFGMLQAGRTTDIAQLPGIQPRETLENLDQLPATYAADDEGVRAKIVTFEDDKGTSTENDDESRTAVQAGVNVPIPQSLTVDQMQKWSSHDISGKSEYWDASDTRFRYVVRDATGNPKASLGELSAMLHSVPDGNQLLVSKPCFVHPNDRSSLADCDADYSEGVTIPGEVGLGIYQRNHTGNGRDFVQIDGRLSNTMHAGARILGGVGGFSVGRLEGEVKNIPANKNATDPAFRLRMEMVGEGKSPPESGGGGGGGGGDDGEECTIFFCAKAEARVKNVFASFDFSPGADDARLIEGVINQGGATKQGLEIRSYDDPIDRSNPTPVHVEASVEVDPINVFFHAGLPLIGGADFALISELHAALDLNFEHFRLRHNLLHIKALSEGGNSTIGPIDYYIYLMHGSAYGLFVKIFGIDFLPPSLPPPTPPPAGAVSLNFVDCEVGGLNILFPDFSNELEMTSGDERNVVMWPFLDPRIHFSGLLGGLVNFARVVAAPFFCLTDADSMELMTADHPGDPVGVTRTGHGVPNATDSSTAVTPPPPVVTPPGTGAPDFTVSGTLGMCGTHTFDDLTVPVGTTVRVASVASAPNTTGTGEDCPAGEERGLTIVARSISVSGTIDANALSTTSTGTAAFNGGAGHRGTGGAGSNGASGGPAYGDGSNNPITEGGSQQGPALGGGVVNLQAQHVDINAGGIVRANGADRPDDTSGTCGVLDSDPGTPGNQTIPTTGGAGGGAASGGGVIIVATRLDNDGAIQARGGNGGDGKLGGGGGGGGGAIKIVSPLQAGAGSRSRIGGAGGAGGAALCPGSPNPAPAGGGGNTGQLVSNDAPQSRPEPIPDVFWTRDETGAQLKVPFSSAAKGGAATGYQVALCGQHKATSAISGAPDNTALNELFAAPTQSIPPPFGSVCGSSSGATFLGHAQVGSDQVTYDPDGSITTIDVSATDLANGYWGLWTVVFKPDGAGESCMTNPFDCEVIEAPPERVELVIGVDNDNPDGLSISSPVADFLTNVGQVSLDFEVFDQADLSGLAAINCRNESTTFIPCEQGGIDWPLSSGDGPKTITVEAFDVAGNRSEVTVSGRLDTTPPNHPSVVLSATDGVNGWYRSSPAIQITSNGVDLDPGGSGLADDPFVYRFDGGEEHACDADPCTVTQSLVDALTTGDHEIHTSSVDRATNRYVDDEDENTPGPMQTTPIRIDREDPQSALLSVPEAPDGANGWFQQRPWVTISAIDQPGGSGLVNEPSDPVQNAGVTVTLDAGAPFRYSVPFRLTPGEHEVCWFATDVAGNVEDTTQCHGFLVDDAKPSAIPVATLPSASPNGDNGWYVEPVTVDIQTTDPTPGSTVDPAFDTDLSDLCGANAPAETVLNPDAPSGTCVSVDDEPFRPYFGAFTLPEGLHQIRTFAVDVAGHRSPIETAAYLIDLSDPSPTHRLVPGAPARNGWYRSRPRVVLRSVDGDRNAGPTGIEYQIDAGGFQPYTQPFVLDAGEHTITYRATDASGRVESKRFVTVGTDLDPPKVKAGSPDPVLWLRSKLLGTLLGPKNAKLKWTVSDDLSGDIRIFVVIYNEIGAAVRRLDGGMYSVTPGSTLSGYTLWDGKTFGNAIVSVGVYHFRVIAYDEAGNPAMSGESKPLQVKLSLL